MKLSDFSIENLLDKISPILIGIPALALEHGGNINLMGQCSYGSDCAGGGGE